MSLLNTDFDGLEDKDFEVYLPKCWSNNRYNLDRMKTKERVKALAQGMGAFIELDGLRLEATSEIPSIWNGREVREQWAFYVRDDDARQYLQPVIANRMDLSDRIKAPADHLKHIFLGVRIDQNSLEISLRLSQYALVDVDNMLGRVETELDTIEALLAGLGDAFTIDGEPVVTSRFMTALRGLNQGQREWLTLGQTLKQEDVVEAGDAIFSRVKEVAQALAPIFRFCMWTKDNDHLSVEAQLNALTEAKVTAAQKREEAREQKAAAHAQRAEAARERTSNKMAAEAAWRKMQSQRTTKPPAASGQVEATPDAKDRRERGRDTSSKRDRSTTGRQRPKSKSPQSAKSAQGHRAERSTRPASKGDGGRRSPKKAAPTFNVGDRCRLERGIFAGKEGVIAAKGKPGYYSVKVGVLEVNLSAFDLTGID